MELTFVCLSFLTFPIVLNVVYHLGSFLSLFAVFLCAGAIFVGRRSCVTKKILFVCSFPTSLELLTKQKGTLKQNSVQRASNVTSEPCGEFPRTSFTSIKERGQGLSGSFGKKGVQTQFRHPFFQKNRSNLVTFLCGRCTRVLETLNHPIKGHTTFWCTPFQLVKLFIKIRF